MTISKPKTELHPDDKALADYLAGGKDDKGRQAMERHLASCDHCLDRISAAHDAVSAFNDTPPVKKKGPTMKKLNIYLMLAVTTFILSFITPRFFIQLLVATLLLGIKWVADSRSARMLVMIHEAWKKDGAKGASDILERLDTEPRNRIFSERSKNRSILK